MDYCMVEMDRWLEQNVRLADAFSPDSLRELTKNLLMGRNYRLITEQHTKGRLMFAYLWLLDVIKEAKGEYGDNWKTGLLNNLSEQKQLSSEQKNLLYWLMGLTNKTATNLGVRKEDHPDFLANTIDHISKLFKSIERESDLDNAWVLLMAGSATLNIRGSEKSKVGKTLEKVLLRSCLQLLGFEENVSYWMNIQRDSEVARETDAEVATKRSRARIEVGLIAAGNQEVIEDKISRVGKNGIVLFDKIGANTRVYDTAKQHGVKLVQIRHGQPLLELHRHFKSLVAIDLQDPPITEADIGKAVDELPNWVFETGAKNTEGED
jgi:hypothetical protein